MIIEHFEDIKAWQESKELCRPIYELLKNHKDYPIKGQIQRAAILVMNNIVEGFDRKSDHEFCYFLYVSKGSCGEVHSMPYMAEDLIISDRETIIVLRGKAEKILRMFSNFIKVL